ncbi:MAG: MFS transporter [Melioribacteraceae bacterium]|nr:MFS transporter [Melioribacteraceae bacterium]MCF8353443.1 MFS transporter [Melioribacteraceae bacterium]MCF8393931.1 MFS transporter [Melioribacteraceae bacterium]MCF8419004.1 MFS transporter [Melioribacteraceae bacterium]
MNRKASLSVIFLTVFIDLLGFGILIPILPTFASKQLGISDFGIGAVVAIYSLMQFLFNPVLGKISDRIGRRPIILISLLTTAVSYLIFSISSSFLILFLSRLLAGLGGSNIGVAQAYIADITPKEQRSKGMGLIGAAFGLGFVFGPMIGGFLSKFSYAYAGYGAAAFSFMAFLFTVFFLPESLKEKKTDTKISIKLFDTKFVIETIKHPSVGVLIILFFIIVFSMANIYGTFAILGYKVYHFTDQQTGYLFGIIGIIGALVQGGLIRYISKKFEDTFLITVGTFLMMIGLGLIPFGQNFTGVAIVVSILALGTGLLQPTILSMISKYAPDKEQGAILGLNQSFASFARVLGPLWGGFSYDFLGYQAPFLTGAAFTLITFLMSIIFLNSKKMKESWKG